MPFDRTTQVPGVNSGPWTTDLVLLKEDRNPVYQGSAESFGKDEGAYQWRDGSLEPLLVDGEFTPHSSTLGVSDYDRPEPGYLETVSAAFRQENLIASNFTSRAMAIPDADFFKVDPNYDVFNDIKGYKAHADRFEQVYNPIAAQAVKADIDREKQDREILAASGWVPYVLGIGAATLLDPTTLIPGGAVVKAGRVGYSVGKTAAKVGALAGAATAVQEVGLHSSQQLRTAQDSFLAVGGSVILGGIIGTAGARLLPESDDLVL